MRMSEITVASWNTLLDDAYPQSKRLKLITRTLKTIHESSQIDVLALQETTSTHGDTISRELFNEPGFWQPHSRKRLGEHIGLAGSDLEDYDAINLGHGKYAIRASLGQTAVVSVHLKRLGLAQHIRDSSQQIEQMERLLEWLDDRDQAIVMGDMNCLTLQRPRRMLAEAGFRSVFDGRNPFRPATHPARGFEAVLTPAKRRLMAPVKGLHLDDIVVRWPDGCFEADTQVIEGASDHALVVATIHTGTKT